MRLPVSGGAVAATWGVRGGPRVVVVVVVVAPGRWELPARTCLRTPWRFVVWWRSAMPEHQASRSLAVGKKKPCCPTECTCLLARPSAARWPPTRGEERIQALRIMDEPSAPAGQASARHPSAPSTQAGSNSSRAVLCDRQQQADGAGETRG